MPKLLRYSILPIVPLLVACDTPTASPSIPTAIQVAAGDSQVAPTATALSAPLIVSVLGTRGERVPGVPVTWTVAKGGGQLQPESARSDTLGLVVARWTLGPEAGEHRAHAEVAGLAPAVFTATATALLPSGKLAFTDSTGIYVVLQGTNLPVRLVADTTIPSGLTWSPEGTRLAFVSRRDGNRDVYLVNVDGSGLRNLTRHTSTDRDPDWSPDGERIAFASDRSGYFHIYVINQDGSGLRELAAGLNPDWSPDGRKVAFAAGVFQETHIFVIEASGGEALQVTRQYGGAFWYGPAWSPDGTQLIAHVDLTATLWRMNADGSGLTLLAGTGRHQMFPTSAWSPRGDRIAFEYTHGTQGVFYAATVLPQASPTSQRLTPFASFDPVWSPDGSSIALRGIEATFRTGIYLVQPDGSSLRLLLPRSGVASLAWGR